MGCGELGGVFCKIIIAAGPVDERGGEHLIATGWGGSYEGAYFGCVEDPRGWFLVSFDWMRNFVVFKKCVLVKNNLVKKTLVY